jgi:hypothetical protein
MKKPNGPAKKKSPKSGPGNQLPPALQDVIRRMPKSINVEFERPEKTDAPDDEGSWSGNVYKYNY